MSEGEQYDFVLDAYALLAFLEDEAGGKQVQSYLDLARQNKSRLALSIINLGEILYIVEREQGLSKAHETLALIQSIALDLIPVDQPLVLSAAHIKANYRMSYADAFAVALTRQFACKLLTGDPELKAVGDAGMIEIEWLSPKTTQS
jgi:predicted nucleic acid-binding protein